MKQSRRRAKSIMNMFSGLGVGGGGALVSTRLRWACRVCSLRPMLSRRLGMPFDSFGIIRWCTPRATRIFYFISSRINPTDQVRSAGKINHGTAWTKVSKNKGACRRMLKRNLYGGEILDRETSVSIPRGLGRSDESSGYWLVQRPFFFLFFFWFCGITAAIIGASGAFGMGLVVGSGNTVVGKTI